MYSVDVIGDFDFLSGAVKIGELQYERIKGASSYRFLYDEQFLNAFPWMRVSADLGNYPGVQSAQRNIFSFLGDALPDRWGRALIDKRENMLARAENRVPRLFDDFGYLVHVEDKTRMGALRFRYMGKYVGISSDGKEVPPVASLDTFIREAQEIEKAESKGLDIPETTWIDNVWKQGSSLGGARPKANVSIDGQLWIAKIPSVKDNYDISLWEHFACVLAKKAGIDVAETKLLRIGPTPYHTLLSKRFDRKGDKRIHFASSLTLTGLHDGDNAENGKGYIDIVDAMVGDCGVVNPNKYIAELYKRVAYNIVIGNQDDHFRNHGFLMTKEGWILSPAYDMNPTLSQYQTLMISAKSNRASLKELLEASEDFLLDRRYAGELIREILGVAKDWKKIAKSVGISDQEMSRFAARIDHSIREGESLF